MKTIDLIVRNDHRPDDGLIRRRQARGAKGFIPDTLDEKQRSVEVVAATENPAEVWDPARWEVVTEVLLMSGCQVPESGRIPLTVEHWRSADAVIGSLRDMRVESGQLIGRVYFASSDDAEPYWVKVREGHLERFSITYPASGRDSVFVPENESAVIEGKTYEGPVLVTKQWTPNSLGLVIFGADKDARARRESENRQNKEVSKMDPRIRKYLERCGLAKGASEAEAWAFLEGLEPVQRSEPAGGKKPKAGDRGSEPEPVDENAVRAEAVEAERQRVVEIRAMCDRHECGDMADAMIREGVAVDAARQKILDHLAAKKPEPAGAGFRPAALLADEKDKFRAAAQDALMMRSDVAVKVEKPAPGAQDLMGFSLVELARHCLILNNEPYGGHVMEMVGRAMVTNDFSYILANVANKSLFTGWQTAEETWQTWCGTGQVSDFKTHYSPRISESDDLDEIPEHGKYKYGKRTDAQESYQIATYGKLFALTRQTIINDDLGALTNIPASHGEAAARKVGDVVYAVLTANSAMGDGTALFHADHGNLGTAGAVGITTVAEAIKLMKLQKDLRELRRLNIRPQFFIAPATIEGDAEVFFNSFQYADEASAGTPDEAYAATRKNPYAGSYFSRVYESRLDDDSVTAYYFAARRGRTVVVFFLNGVQEPYMETKNGWTVDGVEYKVRIDCGAKALDWRGLVKNAGA